MSIRENDGNFNSVMTHSFKKMNDARKNSFNLPLLQVSNRERCFSTAETAENEEKDISHALEYTQFTSFRSESLSKDHSYVVPNSALPIKRNREYLACKS